MDVTENEMHTHHEILFSYEKEENPDMYDNRVTLEDTMCQK